LQRQPVTRLTPSPSERDLEARTRLAWRPAWSIRNRQGTIALLLAWWRQWHVASTERRAR